MFLKLSSHWFSFSFTYSFAEIKNNVFDSFGFLAMQTRSREFLVCLFVCLFKLAVSLSAKRIFHTWWSMPHCLIDISYSTTPLRMECHCGECFTIKYFISMAKLNRCAWKPGSWIYRPFGRFLWRKDNWKHCFTKRHHHNDRRITRGDWISGVCCCFGCTRAATQKFTSLDFHRRRR